MHVKTFVGPNPQAVLSLIKLEMGSEAVILSSRDTLRDGQRVHEVVAGVDRAPGQTGAAQGAGASGGPGQEFGAPAGGYAPPGWNEWHREWARVKEHLYALMRPSIQWSLLSPRQRVALEFLQREGVGDGLVLDIFRRLVSAPQTSILEILGGMVPVRPWNADNWKEAIHIIAGPYGSGKTTSLIRMALLLKKELPAIRIAVINTDCGRGTGRLVLRHWAELSDFMYLEAQSADLMRRALRAAAAADVVFVDTPGVDRSTTLSAVLTDLGLTSLGAVVHVVLQPYYATSQMTAIIERYRSTLDGSIVWAKLDEAVSFAPLLNAAGGLERPVSALSFAPVLRGSMCAASHPHLWKMLFKRQLPG